MAFGINDEVVEDKPEVFGASDEVVSSAPVSFGVDDEVVDVATTADLIRMRRGERPTPVETTTPAPTEERKMVAKTDVMPFDPTSEFAGMEMEQEQKPKIAVSELASNNDYFKTITDYAEVRSNIKFDPKKQTKEEFVADYMSNMRFNEYNTLIGALPELNFIRNASDEDKKKVAEAYNLYKETAGVEEPGGQQGFRPVLDVTQAIVSDPLNFLGFISSKAANFVMGRAVPAVVPKLALPKGASKAAQKKAVKALNKQKQKALQDALQKTAERQAMAPAVALGTATVTEGAVGLGANIIDQKTRQEVAKAVGEEVPEISFTEAAVATVLTGALGFAEGVPTATAKRKKQFERLGEEIKKRKEKGTIPADISTPPGAKPSATEKVAIDAVNENMDEIVKQHVAIQGQKILDEVGTKGIVTDPKIREELSATAVRIAVRVIETDPQFQLKPKQQISDAINRVFSQIDTIDDAVLEQAIRAEGLTPAEFAAANKVSVSGAARIMQQYSAAAQMLTKLRNIDPEFNKQMEELYNDKSGKAFKVFGSIGGIFKRLERESKALITSGIDTTVRNVIGTAIGLPIKSAANLMEGLAYTAGVAITGKGTAKVKQAFVDTLKDTVNVWFYLRRSGLSADVSDKLLSASPAMRDTMYGALQETGKNDISKLAQMANILNNAQDTFFRRAVFNASVEMQLRRQGKDLFADVLAKDKLVPAPILKQAMEEALKTSFSYMPKSTKTVGIEAGAESIASAGIKFIEMIPGSSLVITFPRFMANAMAFQYRYSPFGGLGAIEDYGSFVAARAAGETDKANMLLRQANLKTVQATIGMAALYAAYDHRLKNQDTPWFSLPTVAGTKGDSSDIRPVFPLAGYLAVGDVAAKIKLGLPAKTSEAFQAVIGMKMPAGSQATFLDRILASMSSEKDAVNFEVTMGKVLGDFVTRFTQPFVVKNFYDLYDMFTEEGAVARDPNVIPEGEGFLAAAQQRIQSKLPGLKEDLPEAVPRLREGPVVREGQFFNRLIGFRTETTATPVEKEITKLALDPYRLYGSSSGDREYDRAFIEEANKLVIPRVEGILNNSAYQKKTLKEKREGITKAVQQMTAIAREITQAKFKGSDLKKIYKMRFNRLPENQRAIINERFAAKNKGVTLEEADAYMQLDSYEASLGDLEFASGGLATQMKKAFSK